MGTLLTYRGYIRKTERCAWYTPVYPLSTSAIVLRSGVAGGFAPPESGKLRKLRTLQTKL